MSLVGMVVAFRFIVTVKISNRSQVDNISKLTTQFLRLSCTIRCLDLTGIPQILTLNYTTHQQLYTYLLFIC